MTTARRSASRSRLPVIQSRKQLELGWDRISNGELLAKAEDAGFDLLLTTDKNIRYQQNLKGRRIAIVVLRHSVWRMVRIHLDRITAVVDQATTGSFAEVDIPIKK